MGKKIKLWKSRSLSFRVPEALRQAIRLAAAEAKTSQAEFMIGGAMGLLRHISEGATYNDLMLPVGYRLPYQPAEKARMVTIRVAPAVFAPIENNAPRMWHSNTELILWGTATRIQRSTSVALPMNVEEGKLPPLIQFRVPFKIRKAVAAVVGGAGNAALRAFVATATEQFLQELGETPIKDLLLPKGFTIPTASKVVTTPIQNGRMLENIYKTAPRMYHSVGGMLRLATAWKALRG